MQTASEQQKSLVINQIVNQMVDCADRFPGHPDDVARLYSVFLEVGAEIGNRLRDIRTRSVGDSA